MGYKIVGGILLIFAGCYIALLIVGFEKKRLRVLDGYISLLFYIKGQIDCYSAPISDIMSGADPCLLSDCLGTNCTNTVRTDRNEFIAFPELIQKSYGYLEPNTAKLLVNFSNELGSTFREEQLRRCDYYIEALTKEREKLCEVIPMRIKVHSVLCVCCAIGAAVLLW